MRTWVSCRPEPAPGDGASAGFTLLEVLVVLVIISMAVAVVAPRLQKTYESVVASGERADVIRQLQRLPLIARQRRGIDLPPGSRELSGLLELPAGWHVSPLQALRIEASGACHASSIQLERDGVPGFQKITLREPDCRAEAD